MRFNMKFNGTDNYIATEDLMIAVNAAVTLERPLIKENREQAKQNSQNKYRLA